MAIELTTENYGEVAASKLPVLIDFGAEWCGPCRMTAPIMKDLAKEGMTMVVVTHEMGFARSVADRIIFMADGQILVDTTDVDGFFDNPTEPRAVQFLSKIIDHNSDNVQVDA